MSTTASEFYLPPMRKGTDPALASTLRSIEDHIQSTRTFYSGTILPGAKIAGSETDPGVGMDLSGGGMQSPNFVSGSAGWRIADNGSVEFASGTFRGTVLSNQPSHGRRRGVSASVASGTTLASLFSTQVWNEGDVPVQITYNSSTGALVVQRSGIYVITAAIHIAQNSAAVLGKNEVQIETNGVLIAEQTAIAGTGSATVSTSTTRRLTAGQSTRVLFIQETGVSRTVEANDRTSFAMSFVSAL